MAYPHFKPPQRNAVDAPHKECIEKQWYSQNQSDPSSNSSGSNRDWKECLWDLLERFTKCTTIHGVERVLNRDASLYERCIWLLTLSLAIWGSVYVGLILSKRFNAGTLETVIDSTRLPVYRTSFPVVTICNRNRLNWNRLEEAKERFLPGEKSPQKLELFERIVGTYDDVRFGNFLSFSALQHEPLETLNHVNFSLVVELMSWRCDEFLTDCFWRHTAMNCCEIFFKRRSQIGFCWAFNTLESDEGRRMQRADPMWPWRTGGAGILSGLKARVLIQPEKHFPNSSHEKGVYVIIAEPSVWHKKAFYIPQNSNTLLVVDPVIFFYDEGTRSISSERRQCVFDDERNSEDYKTLHGYTYMIENCQSECQQEYLVRYCNCTLDILFPPGPYRSCQAKDLPCLSRHNDYFLHTYQRGEVSYEANYIAGMVCQCYRNCYSLNYITDVRPSLMPAEVADNLSYVDVDVHFRFDTLMVYRTALVFGWVDLMVAFGGIAGLFLGCSLISGMEVAYFVVIEIPTFLVRQIRELQHRRACLKSTNYGIPNGAFAVERHNRMHGVIKVQRKGGEEHFDDEHFENIKWKSKTYNHH